MPQFVVPQFIDVEDKIIGPITTRQFIMMVIGGIFIFAFFKIFDLALFIFSTLGVIALVALFGFLKVNGRPFYLFLLNITETLRKPSLRVWNKKTSLEEITKEVKKKEEPSLPLYISPGKTKARRLSELALIVDTGGVYRGEE